ncbi:MAG: MFS transporter [Candidatus Peregrinibacteria bacterium]
MVVPQFFAKTTIQTKRALMYYVGAMNFMFVYTVLGYSIAIFLQERFPESPNAIFFVGLILGMASIFALFVDVFLASLQRFFQSRKLILTAIIGLILSVSIFFASHFVEPLKWALFTVMAAFFYGWSYDLYDITMSTMIFEHSKNEEYARAISQKKVAESLGMLFGIIASGVTLAYGSTIAQIFLLIFLTLVFLFFKFNFDQEADNVALKFSEKSGIAWREIFISLPNTEEVKSHLHNAGEELREKVLSLSQKTAEEIKRLPETAKGMGQSTKSLLGSARLALIDILAKEDEIIREKVPELPFRPKEMVEDVHNAFAAFFRIFDAKTPFSLLWVTLIVTFFSFWDTLAITFQPLFVQTFHDTIGRLSSFMMLLFVLPVFLFQVPFANLADRYGRHLMILIGITISGISLIFLGLSYIIAPENIWLVILSGMGNALGYAAAFSPAQAKFADEVEKRAKMEGQILKSSEISAPLRITLNIGNILGQIGGGLIFSLLGFFNGFLIFGCILVFATIVSLIQYSKVKDIPLETH